MFASNIYKHSPIWMQEVMLSIRELLRLSLREGRQFEKVLYEIGQTQWYSNEELRELQKDHVITFVHHAARNVPYYKKLFKQLDIHTKDIRTLDDLQNIPILSKEEVLSSPQDFIAENIGGIRFAINTSGSTGTPLTIYQKLVSVIREHAFISRQLSWANFNRGERSAWLRGDMIVPINEAKPPFWRVNRTANSLMMSSYHLSEKNVEYYVKALESFNPVLIQAYPSSIALLASFLENSGRTYKGCSLRAVVTSSETLRDEQRIMIERNMGCQIFDYYGQAERIALVCTCEHGNKHIMTDYSYVELLQSDDNTFEVIGTGFNNWLMPLLRYKTNDMLIMDNSIDICACGRKFPIVKSVEGRMDDYILTSDNRKITRLGHVFSGLKNIIEAQIVQDKIGEVYIVLVPTECFGEKEKSRLINRINQRLGKHISVKIRVVDQIKRGKNGKLQLVVRHIGI